jgi:hypothetical protein
VFEALAGFAMSGTGATVRTAIHGQESRVRLHLTNVGGDNYRVTARVHGGPSPAASVTTGTMTMWKRIDVEFHQMRGVAALPVDEVARAYEPAFIQLDFTAPIALPHQPALTAGLDFDAAARRLARRVFNNAHRPGWFLLIAADRETSSTRATHVAYPSGPGTLHASSSPDYQWISIPARITDAA